MKTLYVDIDSTLYDFTPWMHSAIMQLGGPSFRHEDITTWDYYFTDLGMERETVLRAFDIALDPDKVKDRTLYPGVNETLLRIYGLGYNIHFLSHNPKPHRMREKIDEWLRTTFIFPFDVTIFGARNCKIDYMTERGDAFGIVEDKPATLRKAALDENMIAIAKRQPWNLDVVERYDILSFDSWIDFPIERMQELATV